MLIRITEINAWEQEKWSYVFDMNKQNASALNHLMVFIRLANAEFDIIKENTATPKSSIPFYRPIKLFAATKYTFEFYDSVEVDEKGYIILTNNSGRLHIGNNNGYKSSGVYLDTIISPRKALSAKLKMRDKKENILYKNFEHLFLLSNKKQKVKASVATEAK